MIKQSQAWSFGYMINFVQICSVVHVFLLRDASMLVHSWES